MAISMNTEGFLSCHLKVCCMFPKTKQIVNNSVVKVGLPKQRASAVFREIFKRDGVVAHDSKSGGGSFLDLVFGGSGDKTTDWEAAEGIVKELRSCCCPSTESLRNVANDMASELEAGLQSDNAGHLLEMVITYVDSLPTGSEKGLFYALDLGGTNFRVLRVQLDGNKGVVGEQFQESSIPKELMVGSEKDLFDFIATELANFVATEGDGFRLEPGQQRELGFTFSFPIHQTAVDSGKLIKWSKGFSVAETVGKDIVLTLKEAMKRNGVDIRVSALVNDTVGTLASGRFENKNVMAAIIFGTGTNACYIENADEIPKLNGPKPDSGYMVINTEWGNFWSPHLPETEFDKALDAESVNPGDHIYEKLISGMYLGEIVRRVLLKLAEDAALFGEVPPKLKKAYVLGTPHISAMEQDTSPDLQLVKTTLKKVLEVPEVPMRTRKLIIELIRIVTLRAARLAGAGIVGMLKKMKRDSPGNKTVIAIDGGLYEHYTYFREQMEAAVEELLGSEVAKTVELIHANDGSGIGATLLAAANSMYPVSTPSIKES